LVIPPASQYAVDETMIDRLEIDREWLTKDPRSITLEEVLQ